MPWLGDWEFCRKRDCRLPDVVPGLHGCSSKREFLRRFQTDADKMFAMRTLLWEKNTAFSLLRMDDDQIVDYSAALVSCRRVPSHAPAIPTLSPVGSPAQASSVPFPLSDRKPGPEGSSAPPSDPLTFSNIDVRAQAAALPAAASGQPFCPE